MSSKKRDPIKWVRDKAKSDYGKGDRCYICGSTEDLDFHHFNGLTELFDRWLLKNKIKINSDEDVVSVRDKFIEEHYEELYIKAVTLCHNHHMKLHSIYGKRPQLHTAEKQERWVEKQRVKHVDSN